MKKSSVTATLLCLASFAFGCLSAQQPQVTPEAALTLLQQGNQRYVNNASIHPDDSAVRREALITHQNPFAIIVCCSDSRVPPEIIFDQGVGDLFVVRVAGNVVGPVELDSIEFAADQLGTPLVMVLGHQNCGAVKAVLENQIHPDIENIAPFIRPAVDKAKTMPGDPLVNAIQENVKWVEQNLSQVATLHQLKQNGKLQIVGGYYNLNTGSVELIPLK